MNDSGEVRATEDNDEPRVHFIGGLVMRIDRISGVFGAGFVQYSNRGREI